MLTVNSINKLIRGTIIVELVIYNCFNLQYLICYFGALFFLPPFFAFLTSFLSGWAGLGWAGLGWAGLGWAGLGWAGLGWAGLGWAGLGWAGLGWAGLGWAGHSPKKD